MKQGKIYIIEDDETIVKLLKQHLSQTYEVFSVQNFRAIKQEVEEIQPDLIFESSIMKLATLLYSKKIVSLSLSKPVISFDNRLEAVRLSCQG